MSKIVKRTALIDADVILYLAACSAEYTVYVDPNTGFAWRRKALAPPANKDTLHSMTVVEDPNVAVDAMRTIIANCIKNTGSSHVTLMLSPKKTFRHKVAKTLPYKGNRAERVPPIYLALLRQMMIVSFGAVECDNIEADDGLGIMQTSLNARGESSVICSIDKDLRMIPGDHYHFKTHKNEVVSKDAAQKSFAMQLLTGDSVDNIQGLSRVGPATAEKILAMAKPKDWVSTIREKYEKQFKEDGEARFKENFRLLKILKKPLKGQNADYLDVSVPCANLDLQTSTERARDAEKGFEKQ